MKEKRFEAFHKFLERIALRTKMIPNIPGAAVSKYSYPELKELTSDDLSKVREDDCFIGENSKYGKNNNRIVTRERY